MIKLKRRQILQRTAEITPLIDVVFILLIFFLLTAVYTPFGLDLDLPEAQSTEKKSKPHPLISLSPNEEIFLDGKPITLTELKTRLRELSPQDSVMIQGDKRISYGLFVQIMDLVRLTGNPKIILAAEISPNTP